MRRFVIGLIVLLAVVGLAATAALVLRKPLAEHLVQRVLAERGYPEARLEFETLNAEEAVISRLTLGPDRPLAADRLHIAYAPGKLAAGDLRHLSIRLSGLAVQLDFTAPEGAFAALLGAPVEMEATETKQAPDAAQDRDRRQRLQFHNLPNIAIDDARIVVITQEGRARIEAAAKVGAAPTPDQLPQIAASGRIESEDVPVTGSFEANLLEGELDARFDIASERGLAATLAIKGDDLLATPELDLRGRAEVPAQEPFAWEVLGLPPPQDGVARIEAAFAGPLESLDVPIRLSDLLARLARGGWNGHASFQLDGLSLPDVAEGLRATGSARANIQDDGVRLTLAEPWTFGLDSVADPILANLGLPAEAAAYLDEPVNGTLALPEDGTFAVFLKKEPQNIDLVGTPEILLLWAERSSRLRWQSRVGLTLSADGALERFRLDEIDATARDFSHPLATVSELALSGNLTGTGPDDLQGSIDLSLELSDAAAEGYRLTGFTAELPLDVRLGQNEGRVETRAESRLRVEGCRIPGSARIVCPLELRLAEAWLDLSEDTLSYAAEASLSKFDVHLPRQDDTPLDLAISPAQIAVTGTLATALPENIRINGFDVVLAGYGLAAEDIDVELRPGAEANFARFSVTRFSHRDEPSFLAPLRLEGHVERRNTAFALDAQGTAADGRAKFNVNGRIEANGQSGRADFTLPTLSFQPDGLQPADLAPALVNLEKVAGTAQVDATATWGPDGVDGEADIGISDMDFTSSGIRIEGAQGTLHLSDLVPLTAPGDQIFRIDLIDAGLPIRNAQAQFGLVTPPGGTPVLKIADASGEVLGGLVRIRDWTFDPLAEQQQVTISVDGLKLAKLFETIDIEGLSGKGTISGSVPIVLSSDGVAVAKGSLEAKDDGALSFRSQEANQVLSQSGEQVDLMMRALKDFRYDELSLTLDKPMQGDAALTISMLGHNPDVLDGYPFQFNITLSGDLEPILAAIAKGRRLSSELLQRSLRLR